MNIRKHIRELLTFKEEALVVVLLSLVLVAYRWASIHLMADPANVRTWPNQYDLRSECETMFWTVTKGIVYLLAAWLLLRAVLPKA